MKELLMNTMATSSVLMATPSRGLINGEIRGISNKVGFMFNDNLNNNLKWERNIPRFHICNNGGVIRWEIMKGEKNELVVMLESGFILR